MTSHDAGDIETLCERVIILNLGKIIYDSEVSKLKKMYLHQRVIEVTLTTPRRDPFTCVGCTLLERTDYKFKISVDTRRDSVREAVNQLMTEYEIEDITVTEPPLEEIIRQIYKDQT
jgi:ABC-2 type transport system ATP-binding protein